MSAAWCFVWPARIRGIGQAIAIRLGEEGANVAINYVGRPEGAISTKEAIERGVEICMKLSAADFDKVLAVNLRGAFLCARAAVRSFLAAQRPGVIINVSSVHQVIPKPWFLGYSVSKGGMQNLTRSLALEYASRGIRVNSIGPGATVTPINRSWIDDPVKRRMVESHIPMRRAGDAEEMAAVTASCAPTKRRTSPGRQSLSTADSPGTPHSRRPGHLSDHASRGSPGTVSCVPPLLLRDDARKGSRSAYVARYRRNGNPSCSQSKRNRTQARLPDRAQPRSAWRCPKGIPTEPAAGVTA